MVARADDAGPPSARLQDLTAQTPSTQAADLNDRLQDNNLTPQQTAVPLGGTVGAEEQLLLNADSQEYDQDTQVFTARGNVRLRFQAIDLYADELRVDLKTRVAVAEGKPRFVQGESKIFGSRLEYNFARREGVLLDARGTIDTHTVGTEPNRPLASDLSPAVLPNPSNPANPEALATVGGIIRFQADRLNLTPEGWTAQNLRVTPDQFDPPELELRSPRATLRPISATENRLNLDGGNLVFDQVFSVPTPPYSNVLSSRRRKAPNEIGADGFDKGGIYYQQNFYFDVAKNAELTISPQFYIQRAATEGFDLNSFGLQSKFFVEWDKRHLTRFFSELNSFSFENVENRLRFRIEHLWSVGNHTLTFHYAYRERFFNGLLFFQTVTSSYGVTLDSPYIFLGDTGIALTYQANASLIRAFTDRPTPTISPLPELARFRLAASLSKTFPLYTAEPGKLTREFLRYTLLPVQPGLWLDTGVNLTQAWYSNGDTQSAATAYFNLRLVLGRFARDLLDYTSLNVGYNNGVVGGSSPFLFDRINTFNLINFGILQQIYGPVRAGVQTLWDPANNRTVDTYYTLSFDHRTYALSLSYNPVRQTGGLQLRVDEFNWGTNPGGRPDQVTDVAVGVERFNRTTGPSNP